MRIDNINFRSADYKLKSKKKTNKSPEKKTLVQDGVSIDFSKIKKQDRNTSSSPVHKQPVTIPAKTKRTSSVPISIAIDVDGKHMNKTIMGQVTDKEITLNMKHSNDMHGKMYCLASLVQPDEFWIDAGDAWEGFSFHSTISLGREETEMMNKRDCDLAVPGNHFFDNQGKKAGERLVRKANFPYLGGNIEGFAPYAIAEVEGVKIAFIGVQTPKKRFPMVDPKKVEDVKFSDPLESVKKSIAEVKAKGIDNVIVISHLGLKPHGFHKNDTELTDIKLAQEVDGIDLIIGGHTHTPTHDEVVVNGTRIVHAGKEGRESDEVNKFFLGDINMTFDKDSKRITSIEHKLTEVDLEGPMDKDIEQIHNRHLSKTKKALSKKMGVLDKTIKHDLKTPVDSPVGNLITDAIFEQTEADVVLLDSSFFSPEDPLREKARDSVLPKGPLTMENLARSSFWMGSVNSNLEILEISSSTIKELLEDGIEKLISGKNTQGIFQMSGLKMEYDPEKPEGERITKLTKDGKPLLDDPDKKYKVATSHVQGNWNPILAKQDRVETPDRDIRAIVKTYIERTKNNKHELFQGALSLLHSAKEKLANRELSKKLNPSVLSNFVGNMLDVDIAKSTEKITAKRDERIKVVKGKARKFQEFLDKKWHRSKE